MRFQASQGEAHLWYAVYIKFALFTLTECRVRCCVGTYLAVICNLKKTSKIWFFVAYDVINLAQV